MQNVISEDAATELQDDDKSAFASDVLNLDVGGKLQNCVCRLDSL